MARQKSRATGLNPKPCQICKRIFQPWSGRQKICGDPECRRIYGNQKELEKYHRRKKEMKKIEKSVFKDYRRKFSVEFFKREDKWFWKAIGDNQSRLENGPFQSLNGARRDYQEATE